MTAAVDRLSAWQRGTSRRHDPAPPTTPRRRVVWIILGVWTLFCLTQLALAYADARRGMGHAVSARRALQSEGFDGRRAEIRMDQAWDSFRSAHRRSSSPALAPVRITPVLGRQLRSFTDLTHAASQVAAVGTASAEAMSAVLTDGRPAGPDRVRMLRVLADRAASADTALGQVRLGARDGLVEPLRRRRTALQRDIESARMTLRTAAEGLSGVASVLEGPRRYLLLAANNAEMRAGSGMFLSIGTIETAAGSVKLGPLRPSGEITLPGPGVSVEGDLGALWGWLHPGREWRNLATTPRFDVTAPLATKMWQSLTGEQLDGVLALDVPFLAAVLGATGPLEVGDGVVSETSAVDRLLRDQYQGLDIDDPQAPRREKLGVIAETVVAALEQGDYSPVQLVTNVGRSSRGRHVLAWSARPEDQRTWEKTGVAGSLRPTSLAISVLNRGGNKLDPFLGVEAELDLARAADSSQVTVRVNISNNTPTGQSRYIAGPHPDSGVGEGDYLGIVAFNLPGPATDIAFDGAPEVVASGADGPTRVVAAPLLLRRGQERTVIVQFRLPPSQTSIEVVPSARVPAIRWHAGDHRWDDHAPREVTWRWA